MDLFPLLRRCKWSVFGVVSLGLAVTLALVAAWPSYFRSTATIAFEEYLDAEDLRGVAAADLAAQRVQQAASQAQTDDNLLTAVTTVNALPERQDATPFALSPAGIRRHINVTVVEAELQGTDSEPVKRLAARYVISFRGADADVVRWMADALTGLHVRALRQTLTARGEQRRARMLAEETRLDGELRDLEARIATLETRAAPTGAAPSPERVTELERRLATERSNLAAALASASDLEARQSDAEQALRNLAPVTIVTREEKVTVNLDARKKALSADLEAAKARLGKDHPDVRALQQSLNEVNDRLRQQDATGDRQADLAKLRKTLAQMRKTRPADDPDLQMMSALEQRFEQEIAARAPGLMETRVVEIKRPNPEYQALERTLRTLRDQHRMAVDAAGALRTSITALENELAVLGRAGVQQQGSAQQQQQLRHDHAAVTTQLKQIGDRKRLATGEETVSVVEPAQAAAYSEKSRSYLVLIMGVLLSGASGVLYAWIKGKKDTSLHSATELRQLVGGARAVAVLPYVVTDAEVRRGRLRTTMNYALAVAAWALIIVAVGYARRPLNDTLAQWF